MSQNGQKVSHSCWSIGQINVFLVSGFIPRYLTFLICHGFGQYSFQNCGHHETKLRP